MASVSVLVVDDAPFIRDLIKKALRSHFPGLQIEEAVNGSKARQLLARTSFDLILCDWEMPELSGLELLQWFRTQSGQEKTPFIMVTSRGDRDNVVEAIKAGVSDYVGKPFSNEQLISKVRKALQRAGKLQQLRARPVATGGHAQETITSLLGSRPAPVPPTTPKPAVPVDNRTAARSTARAQLRVAGQQFACVIRSLSLRDARLVVRRGEQLPAVFDSAVLDLEQEGEQGVARINGYVHTLAALEDRMDCEWVLVTLKFVDQDPAKLEWLSMLIAEGGH
ncbi:response regulator [Pseudomonas sp. G11-1]|uniref:Response regulator receiver domain-containing protein n=1 Tax=Halopseudomonas bauzanensis TaxID=653930 RepID=A0A031MDP8_9GAMM|nr:response regulator [Halopseudomonas bauzanensis]MCO5787050.1 response regulator [Pseudomonas sp. G11-1]MCO5790276.1 response regulator [Pseudomonas sp. G11-2]EZQ18176.1 chemotaxis protein CheY [Halopseudomonas bauzanensis]SER83868.1 Response regulator receiver domain-containing protein [Halopseudomonas bauzanensis]SFL95945.1 Response regulator receiver domain-containing protein [Halopseudomonas bauzanensis]